MVLFVGQIDTRHRDRETFQEVDYRAMFGGLAKWVAEVDQTERLPEYIARAFRVAMSGRPGPVVLALPENMLSGQAEVADFSRPLLSVRYNLNESKTYQDSPNIPGYNETSLSRLMDAWKYCTEFRVILHPQYKATKRAKRGFLLQQVPTIKENHFEITVSRSPTMKFPHVLT